MIIMNRILTILLVWMAIGMGVVHSAPYYSVELDPYLSAIETDWSNFGCTSGSSEYMCVDDNAGISDGLFIVDSNNSERFYMENLPGSAVVVYQVIFRYYAEDFGCYTGFRPYFSLYGNKWYGDIIDPEDDTRGWHYVLLTSNPLTGDDWTVSQINALQAGMSTQDMPAGVGCSRPGVTIYSMDMKVSYGVY